MTRTGEVKLPHWKGTLPSEPAVLLVRDSYILTFQWWFSERHRRILWTWLFPLLEDSVSFYLLGDWGQSTEVELLCNRQPARHTTFLSSRNTPYSIRKVRLWELKHLALSVWFSLSFFIWKTGWLWVPSGKEHRGCSYFRGAWWACAVCWGSFGFLLKILPAFPWSPGCAPVHACVCACACMCWDGGLTLMSVRVPLLFDLIILRERSPLSTLRWEGNSNNSSYDYFG